LDEKKANFITLSVFFTGVYLMLLISLYFNTKSIRELTAPKRLSPADISRDEGRMKFPKKTSYARKFGVLDV